MKNILIFLLALIPFFGRAQSNTLVISEVYGGGGNFNAAYKNDYIQLFNLSSSPLTLDGYSIQVARADKEDWMITNLSGVLQPNHWYLLTGESNGTAGNELPPADATGNFNLNTESGKIALVNSKKALTSLCFPFTENVVDFLGYGTTDCAETSTAPAHNNLLATSRFIFTSDANNNTSDFTLFPPNPRNSSEIALPITLNTFAVNKIDRANHIHWQVNCLSTSVTFELERSATLQNFTKIYSATESQARCAAPFDFNDNNPNPGANYYRLKIADIDGKIYYSKIALSVNDINGTGRLKIIPTIATSLIELYYSADRTENIQLHITDIQGKMIFKQSIAAVRGENNISVQTGTFSKGQYYVTIVSNGIKTAAAKFVKQ